MYDITDKITPYWEPHFVFPLLAWKKEVKKEDVSVSKLKLLETTNMKTDIAQHLKNMGLKAPTEQETANAMAKLEAEIRNYEDSIRSFKAACIAYKQQSEGQTMSATTEKINILELNEWWQQQPGGPHATFGRNVDNKLLKLARLLFSMGRYAQAKKHLEFYHYLVYDLIVEAQDMEKRLSVSWGIAATTIMIQCIDPPLPEVAAEEDERLAKMIVDSDGNDAFKRVMSDTEVEAGAESAVKAILRLYDMLDSSANTMKRQAVLLQKSWLLHWAMWPLFRYYFSLSQLVGYTCKSQSWTVLPDWLISEGNLTVVHLVCPHMLRYYAVYAILNRTRKDHCQAVISAIATAQGRYSDPLTSLLEALFINFDFNAAQVNMGDVNKCCSEDFLLAPLTSVIEETARLLIFETYCRIHRSINIDMIANKLSMPSEVAERWIVNLIRHARLEAKIDSKKNRVEMCAGTSSLYHQVVDKTSSLYNRTNLVYANFSRPTGSSGAEPRPVGEAGGERNIRKANRGENPRWGARNNRNFGDRQRNNIHDRM